MRIFLLGSGRATDTITDMLIADRALVLRMDTQDVNNVEHWPFKPDLIASIGYVKIIKQHVIDQVEGRIFNCHYALLPNHRGRSAVPWAILDGDTYSGITYHWIDAGVDTGRILMQAAAQIDPQETQATLFEKLHDLAIAYWPTALHLARLGVPGAPHVGRAQYHRAGPPCGGVIDLDWPFAKVERFIRAMTYPPLPYATFHGQEVRTMDEYMRLRDA